MFSGGEDSGCFVPPVLCVSTCGGVFDRFFIMVRGREAVAAPVVLSQCKGQMGGEDGLSWHLQA